VLTFAQFAQLNQMAFNAISVIPHVSNGLAKPRALSPEHCFNMATKDISVGRTREVHVDPVKGQTWTFDWTYAAPLRNPHF
jgi:hypothetical protein